MRSLARLHLAPPVTAEPSPWLVRSLEHRAALCRVDATLAALLAAIPRDHEGALLVGEVPASDLLTLARCWHATCMPRPDPSAAALTLASRCVHVLQLGPNWHVTHTPPGTHTPMPWSLHATERDARADATDLARMLATYVDLGLAHERARREAPAPRAPATDCHGDDDGDPG